MRMTLSTQSIGWQIPRLNFGLKLDIFGLKMLKKSTNTRSVYIASDLQPQRWQDLRSPHQFIHLMFMGL